MTFIPFQPPSEDLSGFLLIDRFNRANANSLGNAEYPTTAWTENESAGSVKIVSNKAEIRRTGGASDTEAIHDFTAQSSGTFTIKYDFEYVSNDLFILKVQAGANNRILLKAETLKLKYNDGSWQDLKAIATGNTYSIEITINMTAGTYDISVDSGSDLTGATLLSSGNIDQCIWAANESDSYHHFIDNVKVYTGTSEPSTGGSAGLLYANRQRSFI